VARYRIVPERSKVFISISATQAASAVRPARTQAVGLG